MTGARARKPRNVGGITERSPGKFLIRLYIGTDAGGRRHYYCETFHGKVSGAKGRLRELVTRRQSGEPLKLGNDTLDAFLDEWLTATKPTVKEASASHYARIANIYIRPPMGRLLLTRIETSTIEAAYQAMEKAGLASSTIGYVHVILKSVFKLAIERRKISRNPMAGIKLRSRAAKTREATGMTAEEVGKFLDAAEGTRFGAFFALAFHTGCRPGELLGLKWGDLDQAARTLAIRRTIIWRDPRAAEKADSPLWYLETPKTKLSARTLPLADSIIDRLQAHRRAQLEEKMKAGGVWRNHDFIFADEVGGPYSQKNLGAIFKAILRAAGLPAHFSPYSTRHTTASLLMAGGINPKVVSERLGHSNISITLQTYSHLQAGMQAGASAELDRLIPAKRG